MKQLITRLLLTLFLATPFLSHADEGMWLPMFVSRLNYTDMQKMGLKLTPEEIYSINNSSLKDAIVMLSGGSCTSELISSEGLLLTNHHCAYGAIQGNSSPEHDYLTDGFWAMSKDQELQAEGMTASLLVRMEDVTEKVLNELTEDMSESERDKVIAQVSDSLVNEAEEGTEYNATVKSFFEGNEFYLFVYITYEDVRLVGAPPSSIGKYGGDTDNWMWPRHTGDFSLLRIYTAPDGSPAGFAEENVPFKPQHHLPVSLEGVKANDFAMIMGYPGSTDRYLTSTGVRMAVELDQPARIQIRGKKLDIYKKYMNQSDDIRIKYASKYARVSNYWKYFIGQTTQVKKNRVIEKKEKIENDFQMWADKGSNENYKMALKWINEGYEGIEPYQLSSTYLGEALFGSEIMLFAYRLSGLQGALSAEEPDPEKIEGQVQNARGMGAKHFKDYEEVIDREVTAAMFEMYHSAIPQEQQPDYFIDLVKKNKGDFSKMVDKIFEKSFLSNETSFNQFLDDPSAKAIQKDPAMTLAMSFLMKFRGEIRAAMEESYSKMDKGNRYFVAGLREFQPNKSFYPNANSTMRLTYGQVLPYAPYDAVSYNFFTTIDGVMEKEDPDNPEFIVPEKLKKLYAEKDYGQYSDKNGILHVCFLSNNDITGGNSGSPVINGKGHLIGLAFDGNWEAMSGDIFFENKVQRTISVDIRYVLFIIDKYAGATNIIDELTLIRPIVKSPVPAETKNLQLKDYAE